MKRLFLILLLASIIYNAHAQVTIGSTATPQVGSVLDLQSGGNKALLLPRVADTSSITTPSFGMFIYATGSNKTYFHDGTRWVEVANVNTAWSLTGNAGTVDGTNFIGTTDNTALSFRVNNQKAGRIEPASFNTFFGILAGANNMDFHNTAIGYKSLTANITGRSNTSLGSFSLTNNTTGWFNVAIGAASLSLNTTGQYNTAIGSDALYLNSSGSYNTAVGQECLLHNTASYNNAFGYQSLYSNTTGGYNTSIGWRGLYSNTTGNYNTAIGYEAGNTITTGSNNTVLGYATNVADPTASNQLNIANNIFGSGLTGSISAPAGNIGIGTSTPASVLDVNGSFGKAITVLSTSASLTLNAAHSTVIIKSGVTATITLPAPASCARRTYTIINHNLLGGGSISSYINLSGTISTSLPILGSSMTIQSDGNDWYQIQ